MNLSENPSFGSWSLRPSSGPATSRRPFSGNYEFYEELHTVIDREPVEMLDPELRGLFASIGSQKGKPFAPDARMKEILTDAVAVANATARSPLWDERNQQGDQRCSPLRPAGCGPC